MLLIAMLFLVLAAIGYKFFCQCGRNVKKNKADEVFVTG